MISGRGSGVLAHITSLPGRHGIGDLGQSAYRFVDFLSEASQSCWQFLPIGPAGTFDNSPYMGLSAFAGNPLFIDPDQLLEDGFLRKDHLEEIPVFSEYFVEFERVIPYKRGLFQAAFVAFLEKGASLPVFEAFCKEEESWLDDYALFMALREENDEKPWHVWPEDLAHRRKKAIAESRKRLRSRLLYHKFIQYCFFTQWGRLRRYAAGKGVALVGDIPIYVGFDSADVWAHQECFKLDRSTLEPTHVAGVPPDYFSETGQRWGNPIFNWHSRESGVKDKLFSWWLARFRQIFRVVDIVRIDHFRGFESFWQVPASEETAINGKWIKGPGRAFFTHMAKEIGDLPIIAEDLGIITPEVEKLRDDCGFPGMKILQFAFDSDVNNAYLPHSYPTTNCLVYTGTHDNDTTVGWYFSDKVSQASKNIAMRYANSCVGSPIHWDFIRMAFASVAALAITPLQDILGFGSDCRMNLPGSTNDNWRWRCAPQFLSDEIRMRLRDETIFYGRAKAWKQ